MKMSCKNVVLARFTNYVENFSPIFFIIQSLLLTLSSLLIKIGLTLVGNKYSKEK